MMRFPLFSRVLLLSFLVGLLHTTPLQAQDEQPTGEQPVRLVLKDGSRLIGTILNETDDTIAFRTASGVEMTIPRDQVEGVEVLRGTLVQGRYLRDDPNHTRLFFGPTARSLGAGKGYVSLYEIFLPSITVGVTNHAMIGGGISLIPGLSDQVIYGGPKLIFLERPRGAVAAGAFVVAETNSGAVGGFFYGLGTFGRPDASVTIGLIFGFADDEIADSPAVLIGGEYQLSNNIKLLSENYVIPGLEGGVIVSGGVRFFGERLSADFGLFTSPDAFEGGGFPFLPWIGFAYSFGR